MASWAPSASEVAAPRRAARRVSTRPRLAGGTAWIALGGLLLVGVVFLNVAVLRLNLQLDDLGAKRTKLRAENAVLASQVSSAADSLKIEAQARRLLGLAPAGADQIDYLDLSR